MFGRRSRRVMIEKCNSCVQTYVPLDLQRCCGRNLIVSDNLLFINIWYT